MSYQNEINRYVANSALSRRRMSSAQAAENVRAAETAARIRNTAACAAVAIDALDRLHDVVAHKVAVRPALSHEGSRLMSLAAMVCEEAIADYGLRR
jgi:hypothetical protein